MRLKDKVAVVTGTAQGLGRAFCIKLAEEGAKVVAADINLAGAEETVSLIREKGLEALAIKVDVTKEEDVQAMVTEAVTRFGGIDILLNNAAIYYGLQRKPFYEIEAAEFDQVLAVNVKGLWMATKAVYPAMKQRGKGKVINISSETFFTGSNGFVHYVASKGGVVALTRSIAREVGQDNICVNAIAPGFTATEASAGLASLEKYDVSKNCIKRLGQPQDLVGIVAFLASDESDFISGQTILVDGGREMH
ncbi:MAG: SDR family NAD(P)-dependent oxidoreductase [Carboxydocellales bacterium]